jgi:hypothetical protein
MNKNTNDNDSEQYEHIVPQSELAQQGLTALAYLASGVLLFAMAALAGRGFMGLALSVIAFITGIGILLSRTTHDKKLGAAIAIAGLLGMGMRLRVPIIQPIAGTVLVIGALQLIVWGLIKGVRFLITKKFNRS